MMIRACANIGFLFTELPYLERFGSARRAGFEAVEFAWPRVDWNDLGAAIRDARLLVAQMNMDAGDLAAGERGWASHPEAVDRWRRAFADALELARLLDCRAINVLAGNAPPGVGREVLERTLADNLRWALAQASASQTTLLLEVLNATDLPAYLFTDTSSAARFVRRIDDPRFRLQFDTYHVAMAEEDPVARFRQLAPLIGHVQVADAPGRHEPGTGEIDFAAFFAAFRDAEFGGWVGLEYLPSRRTEASLGWLPSLVEG